MTLHDQILAKLAELRATAEAAKHGRVLDLPDQNDRSAT